MQAALLGLNHPHSGILLTTLVNLTEITSVCLWDANPAVMRALVAPDPNLLPEQDDRRSGHRLKKLTRHG
jgi:hypothetical protein